MNNTVPYRIKYTGLWKLCQKRGISKNRLCRYTGLSKSIVFDKLLYDKPVSPATINKLCAVFDCQPGDIMEYVPQEEDEPHE